MNRGALVLILALAVGVVGIAAETGAPRGKGGGVLSALPQDEGGPAYNGQFTYVRIRYGESGSDLRTPRAAASGGGGAERSLSWAHDWPDAEINFTKILEATTFIDTFRDPGNSGRILTLDDPELFNYPVATIIEVGNWSPSDSEIENLRAYLLKGGFLIVDDTRQERGYEFQNFYSHMKRALPEYEIQAVPDDHEIFNSFFYIPEPLAMAACLRAECPRVPGHL